MPKRPLSPTGLPQAKRAFGAVSHREHSAYRPFNALYDEIILVIFSYLSYADLCAVQHVNRNWSRLAQDNQLWKSLYLNEYGRTRLRGVRGFIKRSDGRETKPLPGRARHELPEDFRDWKWMFRISSNWRTGRCSVERLYVEPDDTQATPSSAELAQGVHVLLAGALTITTSRTQSMYPEVQLVCPFHGMRSVPCRTPRTQPSTFVTALALDQSPPSHAQSFRLAAFLSTGEFIVFSIDNHDKTGSIRQLAYLPAASTPRTTPVIQAAFHGRLLATLSQSFHLSLYELTADAIIHRLTLSSFASYPPSSVVLTPTGTDTYKLIIAYAIPVFPAHWSVGATELLITTAPVFVVSSSRTTRAYDVPSGWIDEHKLRVMREQWGRRVARVADTQTDGKWVVLAPGEAPPRADANDANNSSDDDGSSSSSDASPSPSPSPSTSSFVASRMHSPSSLQLYRLSLPSGASAPKLTYVRSLHGQLGPVTALALADGRCVSLGANGSIWVWDLEAGSGAEVYAGVGPSGDDEPPVEMDVGKGHVVFDERRIVTADARGVEVRRFDV